MQAYLLVEANLHALFTFSFRQLYPLTGGLHHPLDMRFSAEEKLSRPFRKRNPGLQPVSALLILSTVTCALTETSHVTLSLGIEFHVLETWMHLQNMCTIRALPDVADGPPYQFSFLKS
jgi:hypothetical protein